MDELVDRVRPTLRALRRTPCLEARCGMFAGKVGLAARREA